jgi:hypothetical protein
MTTLLIKDKLQHEIDLIPEHQLAELFNVIHYFRLGIQSMEKINSSLPAVQESHSSIRDNPAFGMWKDLQGDSREFLQHIRQQQWR